MSASASGKAVLVVENDADVRDMLRERFRRMGLEPVCVSSCGEALEALKGARFALAVVDLGMSPIDGRTCGGYVNVLYPTLPLLAYTAYAEAADAPLEGFSACYVKGRDERLLLERVAQLTGCAA